MAGAAEPRITPLSRDRSAADGAAARGLSIVVPLYNESASLERLHARLTEIAERLAGYAAIGYRHLVAGFPAPYDEESMTRLATEVLPILERG